MSYLINEQQSGVYQVTLLNQNKAPVAGSDIDSLTLTLYDTATRSIINNRNKQDVLNNNGVSLDGSGLLTWDVTPSDTAIVTPRASTIQTRVNGDLVLGVEEHIALFVATWENGAKEFPFQFTINVINLDFLP